MIHFDRARRQVLKRWAAAASAGGLGAQGLSGLSGLGSASVGTARWVAGGSSALLGACNARKPLKGRRLPSGSRVLALGDSLTQGNGAVPEAAYPAVLAGLSGWDVGNAGISGDTSAQALARLPPLLEQHRTSLTVISIGGNDLLRRLPEDGLRDNIRRMVSLCLAAESQVLLVAMPRPTLASRVTASLDDHPLYGELSEQLQVPLHRRGWSDVLQDASLRSDEIHANAEGYKQFAMGLMATLRAVGLIIA